MTLGLHVDDVLLVGHTSSTLCTSVARLSMSTIIESRTCVHPCSTWHSDIYTRMYLYWTLLTFRCSSLAYLFFLSCNQSCHRSTPPPRRPILSNPPTHSQTRPGPRRLIRSDRPKVEGAAKSFDWNRSEIDQRWGCSTCHLHVSALFFCLQLPEPFMSWLPTHK